MPLDADTFVKTLIETGNPLYYIIIIFALYVASNLIIKELSSMKDTREKVNNHDIEIIHLKERISELKEQLSNIEHERRSYTRKKGGGY